MKKGLVSIIVPVYNVETYLRVCLDSIVAQTYANIEIILVDDGSKDGSGAICDEYAAKDDRIHVIHQENGGVSKARNIGIDCAQGEYLSFIDGDDTVDPDYIEIMLREIVNGDFECIRLSWERGDVYYTYHVKFDKNGKYVVNEENFDDLHLCENRWGLFRADSKIRFNESLKNGEDSLYVVESFVRSKRRKMLLLSKASYHYTIVNGSASHLSAVERLIAHGKYLEKVLDQKELFPKLELLVKKHRYSDLLFLFYHMIDSNIQTDGDFTIEWVKNELISLRREGVRYGDIRDEIKYFLYRYHLTSIFRLLSHLYHKA